MKKDEKKFNEYLFVDGYNIINSWEKLRSLSEVSLEMAREELIEVMAEYQYYSGIKVIIVFDGHLVKGNGGESNRIKEVDVIYTKEYETADQYIERALDEIGRIKKVTVATSDWMEQQVILGRGGTRISARELEMEILDQKRLLENREKKKNETNNLIMGKLDDEIIKKLKKWKSYE
jgi:hypothetical protein